MTLPLATLIDAPALGPRPFLTWYGADGERIELSATVTANWVAKSVNLLVEELDAGPGTLVRLDLPPHWRTAVWALAAWRTGAGIVLADGPGSAVDDLPTAHVLVTDRPQLETTGTASSGDVLAQVLPSLARQFDGPLPPGAIDAARIVGGFADVIGWTQPLDPAAPAVLAPGVTVRHDELEGWAAPVAPAARFAVQVGPRTPTSLAAFCATVLGALRAGSSLVLLDGEHDLERILATEHAVLAP